MNGTAGITPLWSQMPLQAEKETQEGADLVTPFEDVLHNVVQSVRDTEAEKVQAEYLLATGQLDNPAILTIASTKAELSVALLVQLRNKALDAYSELMRISL